MSNLLKSKFLLGAMTFAVMFVGAVALNASPAAADCSITATLRVGSKGASVMCLQSIVGATADGSFGPKTKVAVMAFQSSHGLVADGVVGPKTIAVLMGAGMPGNYPPGCMSNSGYSSTTGAPCSGGSNPNLPVGCTSTSGYSPINGAPCSGGTTPPVTSGPLTGLYGTISDINTLSQYNNEEVGSGQSGVKVLGFEVKASKDGDVGLTSMKVRFDSTGRGGSDSSRLADYIQGVSVWEGSTKVGSASAADFDKDSTGIYVKTISLTGAVVRSDTTQNFYVSVDAVDNLDSGDIDSDSWTIALDSIRYVDGSGVTTTETSAIPTDMDWDTAGDGIPISFVSFSTASDTELKISENSTPDAQVVQVNTSSDTNNVTLTKGKLKLDGTSDVWLDELPVTLTVASVGTGDGSLSIDAIANSVTLNIGGKEYTESLGANCVNDATNFTDAKSCASNTTSGVVFDNLDLTLKAGSTTNFTISADINDIENTAVASTDFDEGDSLLASITTTGRADMVAENDQGDQLTDATELTGSLTGKAQSFYSKGLNLSLVSTSADITHTGDIVGSGTGDDDQGTFKITFDATAFGSDVWVDSSSPSLTGGTTESDLGLANTAVTPPVLLSATITSPSGADSTGGNGFKVAENTTERFTITAVLSPTGTAGTSDGFARISLDNLRYALTDAGATTSYTFNLTDFKTADLFLNAN